MKKNDTFKKLIKKNIIPKKYEIFYINNETKEENLIFDFSNINLIFDFSKRTK